MFANVRIGSRPPLAYDLSRFLLKGVVMRIVTAFATYILLSIVPGAAMAACPSIEEGALWLPADKKWAEADFKAKAERLNDSGQCVIEGSWGSSTKKFYITVSKTGRIQDAKILRFTAEELKE